MSKRHKKAQQRPHKPATRTVPTSVGARPAPQSAIAESTVVTIDPLAPVIVRSGRPFDGQAGVDSARFPPPSTLAGCLRTAWARANGVPFGPELMARAVSGPLLQRGDEVLVPKPADALYFGHGDAAHCVRAAPRGFDPGCSADLPDGLLPVQLSEAVRGKPGEGPTWWALSDWRAFREGRTIPVVELTRRGWSPPPGDRRTHVAIGRNRAANDGELFQTEGLDLGSALGPPDPPKTDRHHPTTAEQAALAGIPEVEVRPSMRLLARFAEPLGAGLVHLGGERRLSAVDPCPESAWPAPPAGWYDAIQRAGGLSLTLVTPGLFAAGYRPDWLGADCIGTPPAAPGLRLRLRAAAVERWQPHSGWDLARWQPRPTRKLIPAGAVYWFELLESPDTAGALQTLWLTSLCDGEQDRRDGFGLALPAAWSPVPN